MDTVVTMTCMDTLKDLEEKRELFNSLTYRERRISDRHQIEQTGMTVNDFYLMMKDNIEGETPTKVDIDDIVEEGLDLVNRYNKTKFNANIIDRQIDRYENELRKVNNSKLLTFKKLGCIIKCKGNKDLTKEEYIYQLKDSIAYLKTIKKLNQKENTTYDQIMVMQFNTIVKMKLDLDDKLKVADAIIENCQDIITAYDVSISYMYGDKSKIEEGFKKLSKVTLNRITSYILGPVTGVLDYMLQRSTNKIMMRLRQSANPKDEMIKYREKMENTLEILKEKRKVLTENKEN